MRFYTIFLGDKLWQNCIDDMNSGDIWSTGGMLWHSKKKATECIKNLNHPAYAFETEDKKFKIVELLVK